MILIQKANIFGLNMNGQRAILSALVVIISVLLISSSVTGVAYAHHKEGHSGGPPSNPGNKDEKGFDSKAYNKQQREDRIEKNKEILKNIKNEQRNKLKSLGNPDKANILEEDYKKEIKEHYENYEKEKALILREQLKEIRFTKDPELVKKLELKHKIELQEFEKNYQSEVKGLEKKLLNEKIQLLSKEFREKLKDIRKQFRTDKEFQEILRQLDQDFKEYLRFLLQNNYDTQELIQKLEEHTAEMKTELETQKEMELQRLYESGFSKIDPDLLEFLNSDNPIRDAQKLGIDLEDDEIKLVIKLIKFDSETLAELEKLGTIDAQSDELVQLSLTYGEISDLKYIAEVDEIRLPSYLSEYNPELSETTEPEFQSTDEKTRNLTSENENLEKSIYEQSESDELGEFLKYKPTRHSKSEGVYFINADRVQTKGITGADVKVAVLDIAFDETNPKIADNVVEKKSFGSKFAGSILQQNIHSNNKIAHGTAVAEIIADVAPSSELFLYEMDSDVEFAAAVDQAISQNVDVIAMSASWPNFSTDGTSHITKKVEEAISSGITFVVPSGNFANKHWEGIFSDANGNGWNEFAIYDEGLTFSVTKERLEKQNPIIVNLLWNVDNDDIIDLDFALIDPLGKIVEYSAIRQNSNQDEQREQIYHVPNTEGLYSLGILNSGALSNNEIHIEIFSVNDEIEHAISKGSVTVPGDAEGVIVVGAVNSQNGDLERYSSQGPTNHGKLAPHVVGPAGVTTLAYEGELFYGTSATTPYIAGIAALLVDAEPNISNNEILNKITQNTKPSKFDFISEYDNYVGYGLADASFIIGGLSNE